MRESPATRRAGWLAEQIPHHAQWRRGAHILIVTITVVLTTLPAWAINNGTQDFFGAFPYVVALVGDMGGRCSGIVITPRWILTAAHCLWGHEGAKSCGDPAEAFVDATAGWRAFGNADIIRVDLPGIADAFDPRADGDLSLTGHLDLCHEDDRSIDWALLHINRRLGYFETNRFHPPVIGNNPPCSHDDFDGVIVGYGSDSVWKGPFGTRRYNYVDGWDQKTTNTGAEYWEDWFLLSPEPFAGWGSLLALIQASYGGMNLGDSGGPLLEVDGDGNPIALCGVASAPFLHQFLPPFGVQLANSYAAVDETYAYQFIESVILGNFPENPRIDGWYEGECRPPDQEADFDGDGDGIPFACDNCPTTPNPGQQNMDLFFEASNPLGDACDPCFGSNDDNDMDGCIDACEPCPGYHGIFTPHNCGDVDDDGVCDFEDNCPVQADAFQQNSNLHAELAHAVPTPPSLDDIITGPWRPGDACDPVPVPSTRTRPELAAEPSLRLGCTAYEHDRLGVRALASHPVFSWPPGPQPAGLIETPVRFCHQTENIKCASNLGITDSWLTANGCAALPNCPAPPDPEMATDFYHRITFTNASMGNGLDPDGPAKSLTYNKLARPWTSFIVDSTTWEWSFQADFTRWTQFGLFDPMFPPMDHKELHGVMWLHASTSVGHSVNVGTGLHGPQLANEHLVDYRPWREVCNRTQFARLEDALMYRFRPDVPPEPGPDPSPFFRGDQMPGESNLIAQSATDSTVWGMVGGTGPDTFIQGIDPSRIGTTFAARLGDGSLEQVSTAEPSWQQGAGPSFPFVVWLNEQGGDQIVDIGTTDGSSLFASADRAICPGVPPAPDTLTLIEQEQKALAFRQAAENAGRIDLLDCAAICASGVCTDGAVPGCCVIPCTGHHECLTGYCGSEGVCDFPPRQGSPHAVGYVPVLSRTRRGVFVVGGRDLVTSLPTREIWFTFLGQGDWMPLRASITPENVLAATYSWTTRSLYFLDEAVPEAGPMDQGKVAVCHAPPENPDNASTLQVGQGSLAMHLGHGDTAGPCPVARLVQVEVDGVHATLLGTWPRHRSWNRHHLVVDGDGALLLGSSNSAKGKHVIARIDIAGASIPVVDGIDRGQRPLAFPPLVDAAGYTIVLAVDAAQGLMERVRKDALDLKQPGTLDKLGDQL